jgi:hypothetical protein
MLQWYGPDNVAIYKIDGRLVPAASQAFGIAYYPYFLHMSPASGNPEGLHEHFQGSDRNYEGLKDWMIASMGKIKPIPGSRIPGYLTEEEHDENI